ncbi:sulfotransferase family protein [Novosphingobium bradum]|uniref:Sulfotransferase family protein n=1 Tax=Novosphingobium bradum TaxID=1737444 RepID=A0ABV7IRQ0_9SPHN
MRRFFFISGLPRSGSTLLGAILRQNPEVHAGMTSPVFSLVNALLPRLSGGEFASMYTDAERRAILRGLFDSYYIARPEPLIFDTNRSWTQKLPVLLELFPDARLVCLVRPIGEILQSFEHQYLRNPLQVSQIVNRDPDTSAYTRSDQLMFANGLIGLALNGLKEAFYGAASDRLMLVSYQSLVSAPAEVIAAIYRFCAIAPFAHDFAGLSYSANEFDSQIGAPGLHDVRQQVEPRQLTATLPPDILARHGGPAFWQTDGPLSRADCTWAANG